MTVHLHTERITSTSEEEYGTGRDHMIQAGCSNSRNCRKHIPKPPAKHLCFAECEQVLQEMKIKLW